MVRAEILLKCPAMIFFFVAVFIIIILFIIVTKRIVVMGGLHMLSIMLIRVPICVNVNVLKKCSLEVTGNVIKMGRLIYNRCYLVK